MSMTNSSYISHTEPLCKELRVLKVFDTFYVGVWKFYYKLMHNGLPLYFFAMKPTFPTVCRRYEIRAPIFHLPMIRHTFAEYSIRLCLINLLNKDTRYTSIMERVDIYLFIQHLLSALYTNKHALMRYLINKYIYTQ